MSPATDQQRPTAAITASTARLIGPLRKPKATGIKDMLSKLLGRFRPDGPDNAPRTAEEQIIDGFAEKHPGVFLT